MLQHEYSLSEVGFVSAENEPSKVCSHICLSPSLRSTNIIHKGPSHASRLRKICSPAKRSCRTSFSVRASSSTSSTSGVESSRHQILRSRASLETTLPCSYTESSLVGQNTGRSAPMASSVKELHKVSPTETFRWTTFQDLSEFLFRLFQQGFL